MPPVGQTPDRRVRIDVQEDRAQRQNQASAPGARHSFPELVALRSNISSLSPELSR